MFYTFLRATNRLEITRCDASTKSVYSIPYRLMYRIWLSMYSKFLRHLKYEVKVIICCQCVNERGIIPENYSGVRVPSFSLNKKKHSLNDLEWSALYSTFWARTNHVLKVLTCMFVWVLPHACSSYCIVPSLKLKHLESHVYLRYCDWTVQKRVIWFYQLFNSVLKVEQRKRMFPKRSWSLLSMTCPMLSLTI